MATNLLNALHGLMTPELTSATASKMGESEGAVSKAFSAAAPLILAGLLQKGNEREGMGQIMSLLTSRANSPDVLGNVRALLSADPSTSAPTELGGSLLSAVFGSDLRAVTTGLSEHAAIKSTSASSILTLGATLVAALLGNRVRAEGLNTSGLGGLLGDQRDSILAALPAGLASLGGLGSLRSRAAAVPSIAREPERRGSAGWLWAAAALLIVLAGGWAMWDNRTVPEVQAPAADALRQADQMARSAGQAAGDVANAVAEQGQLAAANLGAFMTRRLPTNVDLNVPERGVETQIIAFLDDPSRPADPVVWFNFDRLLFETGSATLKPASQEQIKNVAEILRAYPAVKIKIGGYTDNVGDPTANLTLSQSRAGNVRAAIVALGVAPDRVSAEGYGEQHPVADNSTDAGRAQNRRIAMRVTEK